MLGGILSNTMSPGACPVCGRHADHRLAFDGHQRVETYACLRCGDTKYAIAA